jgi:transcriptional regulator with XRE-family HTH domain
MKNIDNKNTIIGSRIKMIREGLGYPQLDLARAIGFESATAVSLIESGNRRITAEKLDLIAGFLNTTVNFLLGIPEKNIDILVALRADVDISGKDKKAIQQFIELAKKNHK